MSVGLVLEGGGMRGIYTAGVLEYFLEKEIDFPYVIAVSAGAGNGTTYVAKQKKRNFTVLTKYIKDPRYLSLRNLIKKGGIFDFDFVIDELAYHLEPLNREDFFASKARFVTGATDVKTGKTVYCEKEEYEEGFDFLRASCSQPFLSKIVDYKGKKLLDGGITDPIPIRKSIEDGNDKNIIVLTRQKGYQKKREYSYRMCKRFYGEYPKLVEQLMTRDKQYNETLKLCYQLQKEGKAIIIQPEEKLPVNRLEKDKEKLVAAYRIGIHDAKKRKREVLDLLK